MHKKYYAHALTVQRLEKSDVPKLLRVLKKILDEAALSSFQGGGINYQYMLHILHEEDMKGEMKG